MPIFSYLRYILVAIILILFLIFLIYYRFNSFPVWGRKKKLNKILLDYKDIRKNHKNRIDELLQKIEKLYRKNGAVDYTALEDAFMSMKEENSDIIPQINLIVRCIENSNKYRLVPPSIAKNFQEIENYLGVSPEKAQQSLSGLYVQSVSFFSDIRKKQKVGVIISVTIGIIGSITTIIDVVLKFLE